VSLPARANGWRLLPYTRLARAFCSRRDEGARLQTRDGNTLAIKTMSSR
jgi:hypothetical protein